MTASSNSFPIPFAPQSTQDTDLLQQIGFFPGVKELLSLRQVHALEHATVRVMEEMAATPLAAERVESITGLSTEQGFYLYGATDVAELRRAVPEALRRLVEGDWDLAVHPRCGTNLSVSMLLTLGLGSGLGWFLPKDPLGQALGFGVGAIAASSLAPDLGSLTQRHITTAIPFNLTVDTITAERDSWGRTTHFVRIHWVDVERIG